MNSQTDLGKIDREARGRRRLTLVRLLLPLGWLLAAVGYFGPWIVHATAGLTLSGVDMGEFVKFLPGVLDGSLRVIRQLFYLPPFAVVATVSLLAGARQLRFPWPLQALFVVVAIPVSLQLLPPAWSPASLLTPEFRLQAIVLVFVWLLLAGFWLLGRLPPWLAGGLSAALALAGGGLPAWQFLTTKSAIDEVYRAAPAVGWGFIVCVLGLALVAVASVLFVLRTRFRSMER